MRAILWKIFNYESEKFAFYTPQLFIELFFNGNDSVSLDNKSSAREALLSRRKRYLIYRRDLCVKLLLQICAIYISTKNIKISKLYNAKQYVTSYKVDRIYSHKNILFKPIRAEISSNPH